MEDLFFVRLVSCFIDGTSPRNEKTGFIFHSCAPALIETIIIMHLKERIIMLGNKNPVVVRGMLIQSERKGLSEQNVNKLTQFYSLLLAIVVDRDICGSRY